MKAATLLIAIAVLVTVRGAALADEPSPAEVLYDQGQAAYARADYATAVEKWQASFDLSGESALLFNLAQAYRLSGDCGHALATYRRFVTADPTATQKSLAEDFVRELERTCPKQPTPVITTPPRAVSNSARRLNLVDGLTGHEDHDRPGRPLRIAGLVTSGAGIALLTTGLVFGHHASAIGTEVTAACATSCDWTIQKIKDADGRRGAKIGYALDVAGVVAIAGGAVMYYLGSKNSVTVAPASREGGAVVSWSGSW